MFGQQQNNQQQGTGFGGFGTNNTGSGFGQTQNTGFGATPNASGSLFGTNNNNGFGASGSGFGATSSSSTPFGAGKPAFSAGSTSTSGLFGSTPSTSTPAFGGFGGNSTSNTSGGLFGAANKPAFGATQSSGGSLFGGGSVFGSPANQTTSAFGAPLSSALGSNSAECQGTGSTPFSAYTEKEGTGSQMNHFQSISFMQPYRNFSFEELRLADYNQGRRFGNASGQAGAFGANNGFGGLGGFQQQNASGPFGTQQPGGSLFGSQSTSASSPFGGTQTANTGFGGGAFGQKAPTTSLFGSTPASTAQTSGSLFGTSGQTGFGGTQNTSGSLFGSNQQQQQKPGFGLGTTNTSGPFGGSNTGFGGGGTSNSAGGSLFGQNQTASPFGGAQQQQPATSNPFGGLGTNQQNQNQTATNNPFGGGFGGQQQKPGGIFGTNNSTTNNTGGGLFGNTSNNSQQQPATGGLFGTNNQTTTNSIFGAPKPATSGTSLFGGAAPTNNNTSNLFGGFGGNNNQQGQNNPATGLFGAANQQQQPKPGGLFGNTGTSTGGGLFGGSNNTTQQQGGGSLFGNSGSNNQPQQSSSLFSNTNTSTGLFGGSQPQQNALQAPQAMTASLVDRYPYGSASIFDGLPPPPLANPGPLATPINTGNKMKKSAILPQYKINPNAVARLVTPQKRGYGFSYSTYGTPSSVSSNVSTPGGLGGSLLFGSIGRGLGKSLSTSNLRRTFDSDRESILSPGAFSAGSSRSGASNSGSLKKLTIDRSLRTDLFGNQGVATLPSPEKNDQSRQPSILKKKVSFDASTVGGNGADQDVEVNGVNGSASSNPPDSATPSAQEQGFLRSSSRANGRTNGSRVNGTPSQPEMEQVKGNELAIVHEDGSPEAPAVSIHRSQPQLPQADPAPGAYYMIPSRDQLNKMPNHQLKSINGFCVGREGCGRVVFEQAVDLTTVNLDNIFGKIAVIEIRSLTVYPETDQKPLLGKGLNVPSTIYLENSWPRQKNRRTPLYEKSGPRFEKHVDRLRKVTGTEFVRYEIDTGTWVFKVPHFTTYALDYDDTGSEGDNLHSSGLSEPPDTPTPKSRTPKNGLTPTPGASAQGPSFLSEEQSSISSSPDDTFDFRKKKVLPGAFDDMAAFEDDQETEEVSYQDQSFLDERLAASPSESGEDEPSEIQMSSNELEERSLVVHDEDLEMAGSFPDTGKDDIDLFNVSSNQNPKSILKTSDQNLIGVGTPGKLRFHGSEEWADELQRTISPRKQDRQALRENQAYVMKDREFIEDTPKAKTATDGTGQVLATSIDLMNSLFGEDQARRSNRGVKQGKKGKGFEWPYAKSPNMNDEDDMSETEREYHESYKPSWGPEATLLYAMPSKIKLSRRKSTPTNAVINDLKGTFVSEDRDIRFAKFAATPELIPETLSKQRSTTKVMLDRGVPVAQVERVPSKEIASIVHQKSEHEKNVWELASILFDALEPESKESDPGRLDFYTRFRKERFSNFWGKLCQDSAKKAVAAAPNAEERAVAYLSANKLVEACDALAQGKDFRLAILVSQLDGNDQITREDMATQIQAWRDLNVLSEVTEPIRTLYGLLAGNTCICEGKKGALEDRARTFTISDRFNLDWKRAFGLRFWYAILYEEPIEAAVKKFAEDLANDENKKPVPWFIEEEGTDRPWEDPPSPHREDLLWGLLKLYASSKGAVPAVSIADLLLPHNTTGNPLDARLSFQLYHALAVRFPDSVDAEKADHLAWDFAVQLEAAGEWVWAIFSVLHLSGYEKRQWAVQSLLAHHAAKISVAQDSPGFKTLTEEFKIPTSWIYEAKALHARTVSQDHTEEVHYLLLAGNWEEAHNTLVRIVAPQCVIEQDYSTLQALLDGFEKGKEHITEWEMGGEVYTDYLSLVKGVDGPDKDAALRRLVRALPAVGRGENAMMGEEGFRETVAVREMSGVVAGMVGGGDVRGIEPARILQLPLTSDRYLKHSVELSLEYYRGVMGA